THRSGARFAYVRGVGCPARFESELRGRFWFSLFWSAESWPVGHAPFWEHWTQSRPVRPSFNRQFSMSFHRLKRPSFDRSLGHKLKPSRVPFVVKTQNQPTSMTQSYILALDIAKHKTRFALCDDTEHFLAQGDLPVTQPGLRQLLFTVHSHVPDPGSLLVVIEATGVLHLNWAAALSKARYAVIIINPLAARRLYTVKTLFVITRVIQLMRVACVPSAACTALSCSSFIAIKANYRGSACNASKRSANNCAAP
ncbi:MAG TPA: transposase, partial [Candidatus Limnocylindrales bacterium]|nr:transposase [Candidatus Limnocylindrales bacterium]